MKMFYSVVNSVVCLAKEARASIFLKLLNECNLSSKIVKNCILSQECKLNFLLQKHRFLVFFTSDVMYTKYKRLLYTPPDLLARFCEVNLACRTQKNRLDFLILASLFDKGMQPINYNV